MSFSRVSLSSSPSIKALLYIPKVRGLRYLNKFLLRSPWEPGKNFVFFQVRCPRTKGKSIMSANHVEKEKGQKGWARPKATSNCLCTQRLVNTVQHLAATCAQSLWTMNLGIIFYIVKWSPLKQRTRMLSTKLYLRGSRYWTTDSALQHLGEFLSHSIVQINKRHIQQQECVQDLYKKDALRGRVTYALLLQGKVYVPALRSRHWTVTAEHRELQEHELWIHAEG